MKLLVTGSSSGIGRALVEHLLAQGHEVWGLARSDQSAFASQHPGRFRASRCDVAKWSDVAAVATQVEATWADVDALITCAGIQGELGPAVTADPIRWSATIRANLDGTYYAIRAFYALLARAPRRAKVVCLSGGGATKARANFSAYGAAKTGIVRLVETIAEELRDQPIDLNAIAPGAINTRLTEEVLALGPAVVGEAEYQTALKQKASGGGSLAKAVGIVDWLLSPASDGISGRLLAAPWDPWSTLGTHTAALAKSDIYTLRRIIPEDRGGFPAPS
jgi:NAD(P)-dependent dehydrogenase (short-subunit alcohol dehydrogenase family)